MHTPFVAHAVPLAAAALLLGVLGVDSPTLNIAPDTRFGGPSVRPVLVAPNPFTSASRTALHPLGTIASLRRQDPPPTVDSIIHLTPNWAQVWFTPQAPGTTFYVCDYHVMMMGCATAIYSDTNPVTVGPTVLYQDGTLYMTAWTKNTSNEYSDSAVVHTWYTGPGTFTFDSCQAFQGAFYKFNRVYFGWDMEEYRMSNGWEVWGDTGTNPHFSQYLTGRHYFNPDTWYVDIRPDLPDMMTNFWLRSRYLGAYDSLRVYSPLVDVNGDPAVLPLDEEGYCLRPDDREVFAVRKEAFISDTGPSSRRDPFRLMSRGHFGH